MFLFQAIKEVLYAKKNSKLSKAQMQQLQLSKFRNLVKYCYHNSNYYKNIIIKNSIDINNCTPLDFPIMDKKTVLENFDSIVTDPIITKNEVEAFLHQSKDYEEKYKGKYNIIRTSGSSGEVGIYVYNDFEMIPITAASNRASGTMYFQKFAYLAKTDDHYAGCTFAALSKRLPGIYTDTLMINVDEAINSIITKLNKFQPTNLGGYAFLIGRLTDAQLKGLLKINPVIIQTGGEPSLEQDKELIKKAFPNAKLVNVYACSEMLFLGVGVDSDRMILMDDYVYTEFGDKVIYCTNLFNYTLPLIRFKLSDNLQPVEEDQQISPFTTISNIVGRVETNPFFINDSGDSDFVSGLTITFIQATGMEKFQLVRKSDKNFDFNIILNPICDKELAIRELTKELDKILKEKQMTSVNYSVNEVESIEVDHKTGKFKAVIL